jgi:carboxyl-terminal processing protease
VKKTESDYHLRGNEYQLTDQVITAFRQFLRERPALQIKESDFGKHLDYIRRRIRAEIITAAYGSEVAEQFLLEGDDQTIRALTEMPKARHLSIQAQLSPAASSKQ